MTIEGILNSLETQRTVYSGFCKTCEEEFYTYVARTNGFCSPKCFYKTTKQPIKISCNSCGSIMEKKPYFFNPTENYCSRKCFHKGTEVSSVKIICSVCAKEVYRKSYYVKKNAKNRFCSRPCRDSFYVGKNHFAWKGGSITSDGYKEISVNGKKILEHRHIVSQQLGRPLHRFEVIHHRNGIRSDNRPENLERWTVPSQVIGQRVEDIIEFVNKFYAKEYEERFGQPIYKPAEPDSSSIPKT